MPFTLREDALTTVENVKSFLGTSGTSNDQFFIDAINAVTDYIQNECGRIFAEDTYENEAYDSIFDVGESGAQNYLYLKQYPVSAVSALEYRSGNDSYAQYQATDYELYEDVGKIYFYGAMPRGRKVVRVSYTAGYVIDWDVQANHTLPFDLTLAATRMVANLFGKRKAEGVKSESIGSWSISYMDLSMASDESVKSTLQKYSRSI